MRDLIGDPSGFTFDNLKGEAFGDTKTDQIEIEHEKQNKTQLDEYTV